MKPLLAMRAFGALIFARSAAAQGIISQLGGFSEQVNTLPTQVVDSAPSPLSLFLQPAQPSFPVQQPAQPTFQAIEPPTFSVASPDAPAVAPQAVPLAPTVTAVTPASNFMAPLARPKGLLSVRTMRVANPGPEGSKIYFGPNAEFAMGSDSAGNFMVQKSLSASPLMSLGSDGVMRFGTSSVQTMSLDSTAGYTVRGVKQWQLLYADDFSAATAAGWSRPEVSQCAGVFMLGGFCKFGRGEVNKTFSGLPPHKQVRVVASYHFIDRWIGETGYMKLDVGTNDCPVVVWSDSHAQQESKNGISLCGDAGTPEGKFSSPIEVTVPHYRDSVTVTFGSTMDAADPCDESWGVSSVEIYVRN
jgi:hypothetical protein